MAGCPRRARSGAGEEEIRGEGEGRAEEAGRIEALRDERTRKLLGARDAKLRRWVEAALPGCSVQHPEWSNDLRRMAATSHTPILFGTLDVVWHGKDHYDMYNAGMLGDCTAVHRAQTPYRETCPVRIRG